jgi:cycloartenol synthase
MKMQGYNGSQLWDTGFAATGIAYAALAHDAYQTPSDSESTESTDRAGARTRSSRKPSRKKKQEVVDSTSSDSDASGAVVVSRSSGSGRELPSAVTRALRGAFKYLDDSQVRVDEDNKERWFRHISKGGWPFSTQDHGWPISDCTAEGLKTCLLLETPVLDVLGSAAPGDEFDSFGKLTSLGRGRYEDAVNVVLSMQNLPGDRGWASYELNRGWDWYELLNPALVFGDIMIDYSYVECTSACVQALCKFASVFGDDYSRSDELVNSVVEGAKFINRKQRKDGAWYGSWAVCFTYGAWFGCEGLSAAMDLLAKEPSRASKYQALLQESREKLVAGVDYLLSMQSEDGGWGESVKACAMKRWVPNEVEGSQVVNTAWALLSIVRAREALDKHGMAVEDAEWKAMVDEACAKAALFLRDRQLDTGDWKQESVSGVFNKSCAISYTAYRNAFPIWALARFALWCKAKEE